MGLMNEAMPREDWEKKDRGEKVHKPKPIPRPEPVFPKVPNLIRIDDFSLADFEKMINAKMRRIRNEEKVNFIGYDVTLVVKGKTLAGWMPEGDYEKLRRQA